MAAMNEAIKRLPARMGRINAKPDNIIKSGKV